MITILFDSILPSPGESFYYFKLFQIEYKMWRELNSIPANVLDYDTPPHERRRTGDVPSNCCRQRRGTV